MEPVPSDASLLYDAAILTIIEWLNPMDILMMTMTCHEWNTILCAHRIPRDEAIELAFQWASRVQLQGLLATYQVCHLPTVISIFDGFLRRKCRSGIGNDENYIEFDEIY